MHCFRGVAPVIHNLAIDDDFVTDLDIVSGRVFLVAQVEDAVHIEFRSALAILGHIEGRIAEGAALSIGPIDLRNLALDIDRADLVVIIFVGPGQVLDRIGRTGRVVRIFEGSRTLGLVAFTRGHAAGLTVQGVDVTAALADGLRGVALEIGDLATDDDFVTDLDVRTEGSRPLLVSQIVGLIDLERLRILRTVLGNEEACITVGSAGLEGRRNRGDDTLDVIRTGFLVGSQRAGRSRGAGRGERILKGTRTFGLLAERAFLVDQDGLVVIADVHTDGTRPVVAFVLQDRDGQDGVFVADAALRGDIDPVDGRDGFPVAGRVDGHGVGTDAGIEAQLGRSDLDLGQPEILLLFPAAGRGERSHRQEGHDEISDFHFIRNY